MTDAIAEAVAERVDLRAGGKKRKTNPDATLVSNICALLLHFSYQLPDEKLARNMDAEKHLAYKAAKVMYAAEAQDTSADPKGVCCCARSVVVCRATSGSHLVFASFSRKKRDGGDGEGAGVRTVLCE